MRETVDYLRREMAAPDGGFYASQDADSEGEEGRYHVWTPQQLEAVLGERAGAFGEAYGVTAQGNFEGGRTHLIDLARRPREEFAEERALLLGARQQRVPPATDHKRVAAWNGYVISGLARVGSLLDDPEIVADAAEAADFVLQEMLDDDGRLLRIYDRGRAHVPAFLDDHAALLDACLELYRAGAGERFLAPALHLAAEIGERFFDPEAGDLFFTPVDGEALVHRPRSDHDGATPNAAGLACLGLIRAAQLSGSHSLQSIAERVVESYAPELERRTPRPSDAAAGRSAAGSRRLAGGHRGGSQDARYRRARPTSTPRPAAGRRRRGGTARRRCAPWCRPSLARGPRTGGRQGHRLRLPRYAVLAAGHQPRRSGGDSRAGLEFFALKRSRMRPHAMHTK